MNEAKYNTFFNIFSHSPYTLSSSPTYSASTLSRFLSSSNFDPMPQIQSLIHRLLAKLGSSHRAFLIADTTLLLLQKGYPRPQSTGHCPLEEQIKNASLR